LACKLGITRKLQGGEEVRKLQKLRIADSKGNPNSLSQGLGTANVWPPIHYSHMYNITILQLVAEKKGRRNLFDPECLLANASNDFYPLLAKHPMRKSTRNYQTFIATIRAWHQFAPS
jgi:hypothetical protein